MTHSTKINKNKSALNTYRILSKTHDQNVEPQPHVLTYSRYIYLCLFHRLQYFPEFPRCGDHAAKMITRVGCCPKRFHMREVMAYTSMVMELIVVQIFDLSNLDVEHSAQLDGGLSGKWWYWMIDCSQLRINAIYYLNAPKELQSWLGVLSTTR